MYPERFGLILPCYNFESGIAPVVEKIKAWRETKAKNALVCFVDDGSTDNTASILKSLSAQNSTWLDVVVLPQNKGKGAAIRAGFKALANRVEQIVFTDCDLHYGLDLITERFLPGLSENDIVIVDRAWVAGARHQAFSRQFASGLFKRTVSILTGVNYNDTQGGLKAFNVKTCKPIFNLLTLNGFTFDVEILSLALAYRFKVLQVPIRFDESYAFPKASTIRLVSSSFRMFLDLFKINYRWKRGQYTDPVLVSRIDQSVYTIVSS